MEVTLKQKTDDHTKRFTVEIIRGGEGKECHCH
jgi:hypothetical protein